MGSLHAHRCLQELLSVNQHPDMTTVTGAGRDLAFSAKLKALGCGKAAGTFVSGMCRPQAATTPHCCVWEASLPRKFWAASPPTHMVATFDGKAVCSAGTCCVCWFWHRLFTQTFQGTDQVQSANMPALALKEGSPLL